MPDSHESAAPVLSDPTPDVPSSLPPGNRVISQAGTANASSEAPQRIPYWLQQAERFLRVIVRIYVGLLVCLAPWYPPAWEANPLFLSWPHLLHFISYGAVRGVVSGVGLLNLWIALSDAVRPLSEAADSANGPRRLF